MDALCTLRADLRRRGILGEQGKATLGLLATRIAGRVKGGCGVCCAAVLGLQQVREEQCAIAGPVC